MSLPRHLKISFIITLGSLGLLVLSLAMHNLLTLITGREDKIFFLLFIFLFYAFPAAVIVSLIELSIPYIKEYLEVRKSRRYRREIEDLGKDDTVRS